MPELTERMKNTEWKSIWWLETPIKKKYYFMYISEAAEKFLVIHGD